MLIIATAALVIGWLQAVRALEPAAEMALVGEAGGGGNLGRCSSSASRIRAVHSRIRYACGD